MYRVFNIVSIYVICRDEISFKLNFIFKQILASQLSSALNVVACNDDEGEYIYCENQLNFTDCDY